MAPASAFSSETVKSSSTPTGDPSTLQRRASSSITATAALLSAPRMPALAFSQPSSTITGSIAPSSGTVSRCAQSRIERSPRPGSRASRLPHSAPAAVAAPSSATSMPIARSCAATWSAQARSWPKELGMRQSAANVSFSRARSASEAGLIGRSSAAGLEAACGSVLGVAGGGEVGHDPLAFLR